MTNKRHLTQYQPSRLNSTVVVAALCLSILGLLGVSPYGPHRGEVSYGS